MRSAVQCSAVFWAFRRRDLQRPVGMLPPFRPMITGIWTINKKIRYLKQIARSWAKVARRKNHYDKHKRRASCFLIAQCILTVLSRRRHAIVSWYWGS